MFFGNIMLLKGDDIMNYARWATKEEMLKFLKEVDINSDIKKSGIPMGYDKNKLYIKDDNSHTIVIGAPGSGKTQGVMLPQIKLAIKAGESLFINDVKGEILDEIGGELKNNNYNIIALDYANLEKGNYYNVLTFPYKLYKNDNKDKAIEMLENIGYYLLHDSNDNSDIFWENTAIEYFVGLVLYLFDKAKEEEINLNSVVSLSEQINNSKENIIDTIERNSSTYQYLFNKYDAEDIVQEVFVKLLTKRVIFKDEEHIKSWLIRVTINQCLDYKKSLTKKSTVPIENMEIPFEQKEGEILEELQLLKEDERNVLYLHYYEGYKIKEIAKEIDPSAFIVISNAREAWGKGFK